jgi:hypothetical protein
MDETYIALRQAAAATGYHSDYLSNCIRSGKLKGKKIGRNWVTTEEALNAFMVARGRGETLTGKAGRSRLAVSLIGIALGVTAVVLMFSSNNPEKINVEESNESFVQAPYQSNEVFIQKDF